jgi:hypothetical protein
VLKDIHQGPLAHSVEHLLCKQGVTGAEPVRSTNIWGCERGAPESYSDEGFDSPRVHHGPSAGAVTGSIPAVSTKFMGR